ncbi:sigma-70 region 4 domain-containing protein [Desulfolutivibrio sp.]|uniref:sigma-70 region 4 domain-containing protein n=1 Tax=Desulfolutivibrio sp. TaxID=2773296 RepID=UPI002F964FF4
MGKLVDKDTDFRIDMNNVCKKCLKRSTCVDMCYPVKCFVSHGDQVNFQEVSPDRWAAHPKVLSECFINGVGDTERDRYDPVGNAGEEPDESGYASSYFKDLFDADREDLEGISRMAKHFLLWVRHDYDTSAVSTSLGGKVTATEIATDIMYMQERLRKAFQTACRQEHLEKVLKNELASESDKVFVLSDMFRYKSREVADILGISPTRVENVLQAARRKIVQGGTLFEGITQEQRDQVAAQIENERNLNTESARRCRLRLREGVAA